MAVQKEPIMKKCRTLGISPAVMGVSKKESIRFKNANNRKKVSEYGLQLKEKQKLKFIYGPSLVPYDLTVFILLVPKHPFGSDDVVLVLGLLHECPHFVPLEVVKLFMHCIHPIRVFKSLFYLQGFNARDERIMLTKIN